MRFNTSDVMVGTAVRFRLPVPGVGSLERAARDQKDDELFQSLLDQLGEQGRHVSDKPTAPSYAPTVFSKDLRANGVRKDRFAAAMSRLFAANKIHVGTYGRPSRPCSRIARGANEERETPVKLPVKHA